MKKILLLLFLTISFVQAESRQEFVDRIMEKTYSEGINAPSQMHEQAETIKDIVRDKEKHISSNQKACALKVVGLAMINGILIMLKPFAFLGGVILLLLTLKKFFYDNPKQATNGRMTNITTGFWYLLFTYIFLNFSGFINWYDINIIQVFTSLCEGSNGNISIVQMILPLLFGLLFLATDFFGILIIIIALFEMIAKDNNENKLLKAASFMLFGILLLNLNNVILFFTDALY